MYAIVRTGGKQYQVEAGDKLKVEKLEGEVGAKVELEDVLLVVDGENVRIGRPVVEGAKISATMPDMKNTSAACVIFVIRSLTALSSLSIKSLLARISF